MLGVKMLKYQNWNKHICSYNICIIVILAYQVNKRHEFLKQLIGVKAEEIVSYEHMHSCLVTVTSCICSFSVLEVLSYFLYLFQVNN